MILTSHIIVGATIGAKTQDLGLIVILGFLSHFIMDKLPHWEYRIPGVQNFRKTKNFKLLFFDFIKIGIDCLLGLIFVFFILWYKNILISDYLPFILFAIFISLLPDIILGFTFLVPGKIARRINKIGEFFHYKLKEKEKEGKITFLGLATQIIVIIVFSAVLLNL